MNLSMIQLDSNKYPETARLLENLKRFDEWKRRTLRDVYLRIGEEQREFFEALDRTRFHIFRQEDLATRLDYSASTMSRLISNRYVEARSTGSSVQILPVKDLLVTGDRLKRYVVTPEINNVLTEEFSKGTAYSDNQIAKKVSIAARRTITKYRIEAGIPSNIERSKVYASGERTEPFILE